MIVRAKFRVDSITRRLGTALNKETKQWESQELQEIHLSPVTSGSPENEAFYASTPSGTVTLGVLNAEAGRFFELSQEYYLDFTPAVAIRPGQVLVSKEEAAKLIAKALTE